MKKTIQIIGFKFPSGNKEYYKKQLQTFANYTQDNIKTIEFGKQDKRGGHSISFFDAQAYSLGQIHMPNKEAMLGYIVGYNEARSNFDLKGKMK